MRRAVLAASLCLSALTPAPAQELSAEASRAMWCGAAFSVLRQTTTGAEATRYGDLADAAFARAAADLIPSGMTVEEFGALAEDYAGRVVAPFRTESFSETECEAAAAD
jgi:hypothetical protein